MGLANAATSVTAATEIPARAGGEILEGRASDIAAQVVDRLAERNLI